MCTVREHVVVFAHVPGLHSFFTAVHACLQMLGVGSVWRKQRDRLRPEHHLLHLLHFHNADWWRLPELLPGKENPPPPFSIVLFVWKDKKNNPSYSFKHSHSVWSLVLFMSLSPLAWPEALFFFLYNSSSVHMFFCFFTFFLGFSHLRVPLSPRGETVTTHKHKI